MSTSRKIHLNNFNLFKIPAPKINLTKILLIFWVGLVLTIIFTWPMIFKLTTLYSDEADYTLVGWIMWYNQLSFTTGRIFSSTDYFNAFQFYPWPYSLAFSENLFLPSVLFAPIYWITNQLVFSVNLYTFSTFVITFGISFYVFNRFLKNSFGAVIAAAIFTFNPLTAAHFPGHTHLLGKFFLPLILLTTLNFFASPDKKKAFHFGMFFTLNALTSINLFIVSIPSVLFLGIPYIFSHFYRRKWNYFKDLFLSSLVLLIFLPLFFHFILPYQNFSNLEGVKRSIQETVYYSAQPIDWLMPFPESLLYGNLVRFYDNQRVGFPKINYSEHTLGLNIIPLILFGFGGLAIYKKLFKADPLKYSAIILCLAVTLIFTFGPMFQMTMLPYYYFNLWTGLLDGTRVPTRFQFFFYLPFSLIAGLGCIYIQKYFKQTLLIFTLLLGLITLENFNVWQIMDSTSSLTNNPPVFQQYKTFNFLKDATTFHIPSYIGPFEKQIYYLNLATLHNERLMNGYSGYFPPEWNDLLAGFEKNPDQKTFDKLAALKVQYLILHKDRLPEKYTDKLKAEQPFLKDLAVFENENYLILQVKSSNQNIKNCLISDIKIEPVTHSSSFGEKPVYFNRIKLTNPKDCYFVNLLEKRYLETLINVNGNNLRMNLKLPPILGPKEEVVLK